MVTKTEIETLLKQTGKEGQFQYMHLMCRWYVEIDSITFKRLTNAKEYLEKQLET